MNKEEKLFYTIAEKMSEANDESEKWEELANVLYKKMYQEIEKKSS